MVLESNIDVMHSLAEFYLRLRANRDFDLAIPCSDDIDAFVSQINDIIHDFRTQIGRATSQVKITNNRKELVRNNPTHTATHFKLTVMQVVQHLQSQSSERMEALNRNMEKEAIVVRIITIVTLVYLPATFVSVGRLAPICSRLVYMLTDLCRPSSAQMSSSTKARKAKATFPAWQWRDGSKYQYH